MDDMNPAMRDLFMGGEDEEVQDFTLPPAAELHQPGAAHAYLNIDIRDNVDGSATVWFFTNDRDSDGVPDRLNSTWDELLVSWDEEWPSADEALRRLGPSGREPSGRLVTIYRNGLRIT